MFAIKKLVLVAACVALALGPSTVVAKSQGMHLRIRISEDSVAAVKGVHALVKATEPTDSSGDDDDEGSGLGEEEGSGGGEEEGSGNSDNDGEFNGGDYGDFSGDEPATPAPFCKGEGEYTMSIEYVEGIFCVKGAACTADNADGVCPGPQKGLPLGAYCGKVSSGVYGCKPITEAPSTPAPSTSPPAESSGSGSGDEDEDKDTDGPADFCPGEGEYEISVEGAEGVYCIKGQACVGDIADGACPGVQKGLPFGSSCGKVSSGVYGCKLNKAPEKEEEEEKDSKKKMKTHVSTKKVQKKTKKTTNHAKPDHHSKKVEHAKKPAVQRKKTAPVHQKKSEAAVQHKKPAAAVHQKKTKATVQHKKTVVHHKKEKKSEAHGKKN